MEVNLGVITPIVMEDPHDPAVAYRRLNVVADAGNSVFIARLDVPPGTALSDRVYWMRLVYSAANGFMKGAGLPGLTTNPDETGVVYINRISGEMFVCIDNTVDANVWVGQMDTTVKFTDAPVLSISSDAAVESTPVTVTVENHAGYADVVYSVSVTGGTYVDNGNGTIAWTLPSVDSDTTYDMTVYATDSGHTQSTSSVIACRAINLLIEDDTTGGVGTSAGSAVYLASTIDELASDVHNAVLVSGTSVVLSGSETLTLVDAASTTTSLVTKEEVRQGDVLELDGTTTVTAGAVSISGGFDPDGANNASIATAVPLMTDATTPSGVVSASAATSGYEAYRVFDGDIESRWRAGSSATGWIQYLFSAPEVINKIALTAAAAANRTPEDFTLSGSDTGDFSGEETVLLTVSGQTGWNDTEERFFSFVNSHAFDYYRLHATKTENGTYLEIGEWKLVAAENTLQYETAISTQAAAPSSAVLQTSLSTSAVVAQESGETDFAGLKNIEMVSQGTTVPSLEVTFDGVEWHTLSVSSSSVSGSDTTTQLNDIVDESGTNRSLQFRVRGGADSVTVTKVAADIWRKA